MTESSELANLARFYSIWRYEVIITTCQTLLYGIYLCLFPIAIQAMVTNGLQSRARKWLVALTTFVFALSTVYWILSVVFTFSSLDTFGSTVAGCFKSNDAASCLTPKLELLESELRTPVPAMLGILYINFIIADGLIVWRAWVLCSDQSGIVLMFPLVMLVIDAVVYLMLVTVLVIMLIPEMSVRFSPILTPMLGGTVSTHLALSLLINIYATSIIALKAWKYRKLLAESGIGIRTPRLGIRILAVLVGSSVIYILIGVMILASTSMFLHVGLLSSLFKRVAQQLVAIYPIVVVLLVEKNRSLDSTISSFGTIIDARGGRRPSQMTEPLSFARGPVLASRRQIQATKY